MGTELAGHFVKEENLEIPPGFESLVPFTLKRVEDNNDSSSLSSNSTPDLEIAKSEIVNCNDEPKATTSVRRRPRMKCNQLDSSCDELDLGQVDQVQSLPKGVIRGCKDCSNCQKVVAKWHPEEAYRPELEEAPVFYPTEEEFEDTLKYISSIRAIGELHGICRIVPPASWKPPCCLKEKNLWERSKFSTRIQRIDKLQNRYSMRKILQVNDSKKRKKRRTMKNGVDNGSSDETKFPDKIGIHDVDRFGFVPGPDFSLDAFQKYANDFKAQYFRKFSGNSVCEGDGTMDEEQCQPSTESIEGEYWRMVEKPTEEIEVLYGADIETGVFGSGFPKKTKEVGSTTDLKYIDSGWNLNNFPRLPGSVLSFESSDISGVLVPWLYIGMCFSSFCWHVEDHHLYSLNYMHWGSPKIWYGVPGLDALKLEVAMRKHLPDLFEEQPDLLHKLVTQLSPSILRREGVPVYRCVQKAGEFVLTFPRAYHAGFNCGFNCAEAVNVAPVDWLPHGQNAIDLYREQGRKTSISHDKLLLGAAREAVKAYWEFNLLRKNTSSNLRWKDVSGKDGLLSKTLKVRVEKEQARREFLCKSSQALKMESSFDAISERECSVCFFDLHLSAAGCHNCSPNKYACLNHAKQLCSCSWGAKFFLFRYDINELNILVEALEGKLSAVYRWARLDLGLALSSYISKDDKQNPVIVNKLSHPDEVMAPKGTSLLPPLSGSKMQKDRDIIKSTKSKGRVKSAQNRNPPMVVLALKNMKTSLKITPPKVVAKKNCSSSKNKSTKLTVKFEAPSQMDCLIIPSTQSLVIKKPEIDQVFCTENKEDVLPSGDEDDVLGKKPSIKSEISEKHTDGTQELICPNYLAGQGISTNNLISKTIVTHPSVKLEDAEICFNKDVASAKVIPDSEKSSKEGSHKTMELDVESRSVDNVKGVSCSPSSSHTNLDRYYRQKGPRIAKVVRRISCNVEPLAFGAVHAGKLWCDSRAIYPKGFRSRVKYIDALDPTNTCYYVSEILDVGRDGPLFIVSVEHTPSEVFAHISAARCWEMVRERVNHEIGKKHKLGRVKLPPLQPPGSLDGIEMFGFSSPTIVQAIHAMDQNRVCTEYWKSRPLMQIPQQPNSVKSEAMNQETQKSHPEFESIMDGLLNKASQVELQTLYSLISNKNSTDERSILTQLLNKEIQKYTS